MSDETPNTHTEVELAYSGASRLVSDGEAAQLSLFGNIRRDPVRFEGRVKDPLRLRDALNALYRIVGSDFRYVPKDRTAYQAFQRMRRESADMDSWKAQQAYFDWLLRNDPQAWLILDPIISVHPDEIAFEVFSKDEGAYAKLAVKPSAFETEGESTYGTTNVDFSQALFDNILQFRSYRNTKLSIGQDQVAVDTAAARAEDVLEKKIQLPDSWIRGFLQVQSAAMLPKESFTLAPIDLYNVLRELRMHADVKRKRRGMRVELVPGERARVVLEPWETVIESTAEPYQGTQAKVVRIWGRRRLMLLRQFLPLADSVEIQISGSGLPSFWILRGPDLELTLGLTGFTSANWSQAASFDLLLPRKTQGSAELEMVVRHLSGRWSDNRAGLEAGTQLTGEALVEALQLGCQQGQLIYDVAKDRYRLRPLTEAPLDLNRLQYRNQRERLAHDLLVRQDAVNLESENRIHGSGLELTGKVSITEDKREYRAQLLINDDGFVSKAECTCSQFRQQGLKDGPCSCLIALRLAHARREIECRSGAESRQTITMETRSYSKRTAAGEEVYQVSLDETKVRIRWGQSGQPPRVQQLLFSTVDSARDDYLARVDDLTKRGYLDASAA
ncbi:MAG: SWIM zinc finger family protein [Verrucomicrobiota bacterium]